MNSDLWLVMADKERFKRREREGQMASLQCVACNRQIPDGSGDTCQCGHVLSKLKTIAGKRFSDYRADLYTRLVIEESKNDIKQPRFTTKARSSRLNQNENARNVGNVVQVKKGRRRRRLKLTNKMLTDKADTEFQQMQREDRARSEHTSPQQVGNTRLTKALAEINERLMNQCGLWMSLASGLAFDNHAS